MISIALRMARAVPVWLWAVLAAVGAVAAAVAIGLSQASAIGELEAEAKQSREQVEEARAAMRQQAERHRQQVVAMGEALAAHKGYARDAKGRARELEKRIAQAGDDDDALDACLGMPLPTDVADGLRQ